MAIPEPPPTRHTSDATTGTSETQVDQTPNSEAKDLSSEEKGCLSDIALAEDGRKLATNGGDVILSSPMSPEGDTSSFQGKLDPFAGGVEGGVTYKSMTWWQAGMGMIAETISLGILALPYAFSTLGLIPGVILLVILGCFSTYTGYVIGQMKLAYPHIHSMADAGEILFGSIGREFLGFGQLLFIIFIMASHVLAFSIMMNVITDHAACTAIFMFLGAVVSLLFDLPRTLKNLAGCSIASFISIIGAVVVVMVGVSITKPGYVEDISGHFKPTFRLWPKPDITFLDAFIAVCSMVFAYAGHVAFFPFISEMKKATDFPKALALLQMTDSSMYITTAVVVYLFAGNAVASPALDSASPLFQKIAYGVAIPTIIIAGVVNGHVAVKTLYVRLLRNGTEDVMHQNSLKSWAVWVAITTVLWFVAWLIAEAVPVFNNLVALSSALFASWFTFGLSGIFWIHLNLKRGDRWWKLVPKQAWNWKKSFLLGVNLLSLFLGFLICVVGLYASSKSIQHNSLTTRPFSCADNAHRLPHRV